MHDPSSPHSKTIPHDGAHWVRTWPNEANPEFRVGRIGEDLIAEWVGFATLRSNRTATRTRFSLAEDAADPDVTDKFHRGQVSALLRHIRGELTMHGSAVAFGSMGMLLVGGSGVGKSSLGAALCHEYGGTFIADDAAGIEMGSPTVTLVPGETDHWLDATSIEMLGWAVTATMHKRPFRPLRVASAPVPLRAIIRLDFEERPSRRLERLRGRAVFHALNTSALRFVLDESAVTLRDFDQTAELATRVPVYALLRSRDPSRFREDVSELLTIVKGFDVGSQEI